MAKTRLQAGAGDDDDDDDDTKPHKHEERYKGAIDCLQQVYKEEGIFGWYQVSSIPPNFCALRKGERETDAPRTASSRATLSFAGYASPDHQGRPLAGSALRHQGRPRGL
jgi:hypothetical protein